MTLLIILDGAKLPNVTLAFLLSSKSAFVDLNIVLWYNIFICLNYKYNLIRRK
nr:MAG TPA: hypothetical protein [Bacteriophage sp.]